MSDFTKGMLPKAKLTAVSMFTTLANIYPNRHPDIVFPPPSWHIEDLEKKLDTGEEKKSDDEQKEEEKGQPSVGNSDESKKDSEQKPRQDTTENQRPVFDRPENPPEPMTFAQKLKDMIESLPVPPAVSSTVTTVLTTGSLKLNAATTKPEDNPPPPVDAHGPPIPEGVDPETVRLLSSQSVMAGTADSAATTPARQSVWDALDKLKPSSWNVQPTTTADSKHTDVRPETEGVMMYAPLQPDDSSEVVLADCIPPRAGEEADKEGEGKGKEPSGSTPAVPPKSAAPEVWVPSTTNISVYTTWWGYRLYLPPPVMDQLDSNQMRATKRATVITAALQWFLTRIPTMVLPVNLRAPVTMLKRLAPFISYIGIFIAWSWTRISKFDKGNGVVLTATWLLPVALIPTAWDAGDIHGPKKRPVSSPLELPKPEAKRSDKDKDKDKNDGQSFVSKLNPFGWGQK